MQRSAWRPTSSASAAVRPLSSSTRWNSRGPSPSRTPVHSEGYGFMRSAVEERGGGACAPRARGGEELQEDLEVAPLRQQLLDAHERDEHLGQRRAHAAVALG